MKLSVIAAALCALSASAAAEAPDAPETPPAARAHGGERFAIDHLFFFSEGFAPELAYAQQHGFNRWPFTTTHTGDGTTGAYIIFDNFYLEFLWLDNSDEASAVAEEKRSDFNLRNAWRDDPNTSPFGIGMKDYNEEKPSPFETRQYTAAWLEESSLAVTDGAENYDEPWSFLTPFKDTSEPRDSIRGRSAEHLNHPNGARVLTGVTLTLPNGQRPSQTLQTMENEGVVEIAYGAAHAVELTFDNAVQGKTADLRPRSPIIIRY